MSENILGSGNQTCINKVFTAIKYWKKVYRDIVKLVVYSETITGTSKHTHKGLGNFSDKNRFQYVLKTSDSFIYIRSSKYTTSVIFKFNN